MGFGSLDVFLGIYGHQLEDVPALLLHGIFSRAWIAMYFFRAASQGSAGMESAPLAGGLLSPVHRVLGCASPLIIPFSSITELQTWTRAIMFALVVGSG